MLNSGQLGAIAVTWHTVAFHEIPFRSVSTLKLNRNAAWILGGSSNIGNWSFQPRFSMSLHMIPRLGQAPTELHCRVLRVLQVSVAPGPGV